ncbi:MAG: hypothetical protein Q8O40_00320 [Chloroflexota bacterium]|nr:hypothetical protein [Chloroflexota bacterium]
MAKCPICGVVVQKAEAMWALCPIHRKEYPDPRFVLLEDGAIVDTDSGRLFKDGIWLE